MCFGRPRPRWEEDVTFAPRPRGVLNAKRHVSETVTTRRRDPPPVIFVPPEPLPPPRVSTPVIRPVTPPSPARIELVSVEEDYRRSPRTSRVSVSTKGRRRSGGEEVYIERERERVRIPREERREEYETYRYVQGPERVITEAAPRRSTSRVVERERVVVNEGDRRREYYRRP